MSKIILDHKTGHIIWSAGEGDGIYARPMSSDIQVVTDEILTEWEDEAETALIDTYEARDNDQQDWYEMLVSILNYRGKK